MRRILPILMVALVYLCPLWCSFGKSVCAEPAVQAAACCCDPAPQPQDSPAPDPESPRQCICCGAVLADYFQLDFVETWFAATSPLATLSLDRESRSTLWLTRESRPGIPLSGRMLRLNQMSLTL